MIDYDVALSIKASSTDPEPGDEITFTVTMKNNGPGAAQNVVFTVTLPDNVTIKTTPAQCTVAGVVLTCAVASLDAGATQTFTFVVTVGGDGAVGAEAPSLAVVAGRCHMTLAPRFIGVTKLLFVVGHADVAAHVDVVIIHDQRLGIVRR